MISLQDLQLDSSYMGKRLEQQPMYPHYTYYYPHYLQTKVRWSARFDLLCFCVANVDQRFVLKLLQNCTLQLPF